MRKTNINNYTEENSPDVTTGVAGKTAHAVTRFFKFLFKSIFTVISVLIIAGLVVGTSIVMYLINLSGEPTGIDLKARKLNLTSFIYVYDENGEAKEYQQLYSDENREWVDFADIPQYMKDATIAIEDKRFREHKGVDWYRTGGAVLSLATGSDSYGGSTLTQQLIKNVTKDNEVSITRKLREVFRALNLEKEYTKDEILEAYLNIVNFGNNIGGVQSAANEYFNKDIQDCSVAECAAIAGITQNPSLYNPLYNPEQNKKRRDIVINEMYSQGKITKAEYTAAIKESENMTFITDSSVSDEEEYNPDEEENNTTGVQNWYIDALVRQVLEDISELYNVSEEVAWEKLYTEGLKIYCAMDVDMQNYAEEYFKLLETPYDKDLEVGYTMVALDGRIIATVGGRNERTGNLLYDRANQASLQPGSSIKPIGAYPLTIENGNYTFSQKVNDSPVEKWDYTDGYWKPGPNNWYLYYNGSMLLPDAIEWSSNATAAQALDKVGVANSYSFVTGKLGFSHLTEQDGKNLAGLSIGGLNGGVTVTEMASAYQIFGNGGRYYSPYTYYYITDQNDNVILDNRDNYPMQALSAESAYIMNRLLNYNVNNSVHTRAGSTRVAGWDTIGKTGTTDSNKDSWFCGLSPICAAAIWTGYDNPSSINSPNYAVDCWQDLMEHYLSGKDVQNYTVPDGVLSMKYCKDTGKLAAADCKNTAVGYYVADNLPSQCGGDCKTSDTDSDSDKSSDTQTDSGSDSESSSQSESDNENTDSQSDNDTESEQEWWESQFPSDN